MTLTYDQAVTLANKTWDGVVQVRSADPYSYPVQLHDVNNGPLHRIGKYYGAIVCKCCVRLCSDCTRDQYKWINIDPADARAIARATGKPAIETIREFLEMIIWICQTSHQQCNVD